ncbi:MAG: hypothetical protein LUG98_03530, partial [Tannerellaceae bacterium]|nr:hypothetical protein [Tannerellaceae bacterium]
VKDLTNKLKHFIGMKRCVIGFLLFQLVLLAGMASNPAGLQQQLSKVIVYTIGGREYTGEMVLPYINSLSVDLINGDHTETFDARHIEYIKAWRPGDSPQNAARLVFSPTYEYKSIRNEESELSNQQKWLLCILEMENISLYIASQQYDLKRYATDFIQATGGSSLPPNLWLYVKKEGETYPTRITLSPNSGYGSNQHFRAVGARYFEACPELAAMIEEGKFTNEQIIEAVLFYNDWKNNN